MKAPEGLYHLQDPWKHNKLCGTPQASGGTTHSSPSGVGSLFFPVSRTDNTSVSNIYLVCIYVARFWNARQAQTVMITQDCQPCLLISMILHVTLPTESVHTYVYSHSNSFTGTICSSRLKKKRNHWYLSNEITKPMNKREEKKNEHQQAFWRDWELEKQQISEIKKEFDISRSQKEEWLM